METYYYINEWRPLYATEKLILTASNKINVDWYSYFNFNYGFFCL